MPNVTLRLSDHDHELLRVACLVTRKSQNKLLSELLHAEIDRVLPGRRHAEGDAPDLHALWRAAGLPEPAISETDRERVRTGTDSAFADAERFWAERDAQRRGRIA